MTEEEQIEAYHPEFGYEWQEPDGVLYKAWQAGREQALDDVVTMLERTDPREGWGWPMDKWQAVEYISAWREGRTARG